MSKKKLKNFTTVSSECSSSTLLAIDGSTQNGPFWSSIIVEAKAIVKGYEKIKGVNFGYGDDKTKLALSQVRLLVHCIFIPSLKIESQTYCKTYWLCNDLLIFLIES